MDCSTEFIPLWVKVCVSIAVGLGAMVGWKRIVITAGEKIGKTHLTYGQGAAAEIIAAATIGAADGFGLPVSTTHVPLHGLFVPNCLKPRDDRLGVATPRRSGGRDRSPLGLKPWMSWIRPSFALGLNR